MTAPCSRGDDDLASLEDGFRRTHQEVSSDRLHFGVIGGKVFERKREESCFELCSPEQTLGSASFSSPLRRPAAASFFFCGRQRRRPLRLSSLSLASHKETEDALLSYSPNEAQRQGPGLAQGKENDKRGNDKRRKGEKEG